MGPEIEETEPEDRAERFEPVGSSGLGYMVPIRKPWRCRLGWHKYAKAGDGDCLRRGCGHNWITAMHEDTRELTGGGWFSAPASRARVNIDNDGGGIPVIGSSEHEARGKLMVALGPDWQITLDCDKDGDRISLRGPHGAFVIEGERLHHRWVR